MYVTEISGFRTGIDDSGVNFLDPAQAFDVLRNGIVYRQEIKSRLGFSQFANRIADHTRIMGIFENIIPGTESELLVCSKRFLYRYNTGTDTFVQIPNAGAAPIGGFNITGDDDYVSGTTYLTKTGAQRFVFTGKGMSDVYFYDGVNVKSFTTIADNPDYQAPALGALVRATRVIWFGERLNFFVPLIGGQIYNQGVLYSGIRNAAGNGDKFNVPGSGLLEASTYEKMVGALNIGDFVVMNFERSNWILEITRDAFNPYYVKKIPSVLGTTAGFSAVQWDHEVKSVGRTGLITTDGRQTLRFDDKIPYFTADDIDQNLFELTYGGFDRSLGQFMFAYKDNIANPDMTTQDKVLIYNYEEKTWAIDDQRFSVFGQTNQGHNLVWNDIDETQNPSWAQMDTTEEVWNKIGITEDTQKTLAGDNLGFVYMINTDYDDYFVNISGMTNAVNVVITVDESAFQIGDRVIIKLDISGGMLDDDGESGVDGVILPVIAATTTSITLNLNTTLLTAYISGGTLSKVIDFEAKLVPFNPYRAEGRKCYLSHIEFLLDTNAGDLDVFVSMDGEQAPFKESVLIPSKDTTKDREWITASVNQVANFFNIDLRKESASTQTVITAIRLHHDRGELTTG
jgi:hypothetical protein